MADSPYRSEPANKFFGFTEGWLSTNPDPGGKVAAELAELDVISNPSNSFECPTSLDNLLKGGGLHSQACRRIICAIVAASAA